MKRIGVAGIVRSNFGLLLGRRGKDPNRGMFVLPGGGVQDGESLEEAFCREMLEETGLEMEPTVGYSRWESPYVIELEDRIILVGKAQAKNPQAIRAGDDLYDLEWFDFLNLPFDISPVVVKALAFNGFWPGDRR